MDTTSTLCGPSKTLYLRKSHTHAIAQAFATYSGRYFWKFTRFQSISNNSKRYHISYDVQINALFLYHTQSILFVYNTVQSYNKYYIPQIFSIFFSGQKTELQYKIKYQKDKSLSME
jgi:hypothetical protein